MKLSKQVLTLLLCLSLLRFTAQAESSVLWVNPNDQLPTRPAQQSPQELQQLVAPIALYPERARCTDSSLLPLIQPKLSRRTAGSRVTPTSKGEELAKEVDKPTVGPQCESRHAISFGS